MLRSLDGLLPVVNAKPVRARDYSVEVQRSGPATLPAMYHNFHLVTVFVSGVTIVGRESAGGVTWSRFAPGDSSLHAAGPGRRVEWPAGAHCLYVHLHPRLIRQIGQATRGESLLTLTTQSGLRDPVIRDIGLQLHHMIDWSPSLDLRSADELVTALAHHVVVRYSRAADPPLSIGRLSVEEILDHFRDDVASWEGVGRLADRTGLTRSHFSRQVRALTGLPPYVMVFGSRIEAAKHLLAGAEVSISEVAYSAGFADQSHLTRAFQRAAGMTPARYRAERTIMLR